jgi:hypothetical protein
MSFRHALAAALAFALPLSHAYAAEEAAPPTIRWELPWKAGTTLEYASEELTRSDLGQRLRTRSTSIATVRIGEVLDSGFVQTWSWRDYDYVVEEGDKAREAATRELNARMQDVALDVELDDQGSYVRLRNLAHITPRLRDTMRPMLLTGMEARLAAIADARLREDARKSAVAQVDGFLDRMFAPQMLETLLARNIQWYNGFSGIDIAPDQDYEAKVEVPNPAGGAGIPVTVTFSLSLSEEDPDDMYVVFEQTIDREHGGEAVAAIAESLLGSKLSAGQSPVDVSVIDQGMFVVHRPTGVPEMFEATRTVKLGDKQKIERLRLRLLNGKHDHQWRPDEDVAAGEGT